MISAARLFIVSVILLTGCHTAKRVAVSSFRVIDAPAHYLRERIDESEGGTTTTTTTTTTEVPPVSDVQTPGRPVNPNARPQTQGAQRQVATQQQQQRRTASADATPRPRTDVAAGTQRKPSPSATPRPSTGQTTQFPTAKPVPGKPGYVYSIDPKGGIVDVTGYKSGDKAKDPYTQQIFIVP
jgi:hypothetical protein